MGRPQRNGECKVCGGKVRHYPIGPVGSPVTMWAHIDRADWIDNPHNAQPTDESLVAAGVA